MSDDKNDQRTERNFLQLALVQFTFRVGWIFKTESVIIPAALDSLATAGWIRGFLPLLSRLGLSVPPALIGKAIRNATRKKRSLAVCIGCMSGCMALMSALWWTPGKKTVPIAVLLFLTCYVMFLSLCGFSMVLFPHYQALARQQLGLDMSNISYWIAVQSLGAALFSTIAGPLADRHGNRLVLRLVILGIAATPCLAISLAAVPHLGAALFPLVFVCIGLNPLMMRIFQNYTIEVADAARRPQALSALTLCWALPVMSAPLVGLLIDWHGFRPIFGAVAVVLGLGWVLTFRLSEPRHETD